MIKTYKTKWDKPDVPNLATIGKPLVHSSTVHFDNIEEPTKSANDRKNMRVEGR